MNKTDIIEQHTDAVNRLRKARNYKPTSEENDRESMAVMKRIEREVSELGQIHNPRISAKSLAALNLN